MHEVVRVDILRGCHGEMLLLFWKTRAVSEMIKLSAGNMAHSKEATEESSIKGRCSDTNKESTAPQD